MVEFLRNYSVGVNSPVFVSNVPFPYFLLSSFASSFSLFSNLVKRLNNWFSDCFNLIFVIFNCPNWKVTWFNSFWRSSILFISSGVNFCVWLFVLEPTIFSVCSTFGWAVFVVVFWVFNLSTNMEEEP